MSFLNQWLMAVVAERAPTITPRQEFQRTEGFALFTDVNDLHIDTISTRNIPPIPTMINLREKFGVYGSDEDTVADNPAGTSLHLATRQIMRHTVERDGRSSMFRRRHGITRADRNRATPHAFDAGFNDLDFAWHFGAALANAAVDHFVTEGKLTQEQKDQFSLHDWANIIGTGWFSRLAHTMALAGNGLYGTFGKSLAEYRKGALAIKLLVHGTLGDSQNSIFEYSEQTEPTEGLVYVTASLSQVAVRSLRENMRNKNSMGCPVARYSVRLPADLVRQNAHIQGLLERGTLTVVPERSDGDNVRATQEWSAIDKVLSLFAAQLDIYAATYGTPYLAEGRHRAIVKHHFGPPLDVLRWKANPDN